MLCKLQTLSKQCSGPVQDKLGPATKGCPTVSEQVDGVFLSGRLPGEGHMLWAGRFGTQLTSPIAILHPEAKLQVSAQRRGSSGCRADTAHTLIAASSTRCGTPEKARPEGLGPAVENRYPIARQARRPISCSQGQRTPVPDQVEE